MGPLQIIIVFETKNDDKSDSLYISEVINRFFELKSKNGEEVNLSKIPLNGKQNYKKKKLLNYINNSIKIFKSYANGETVVIYCIDTDSTEQIYKPGSFFKNLMDFCDEKGYRLVWFCKNAENVFLGVEPETLSNKTLAAKEFSRSGRISLIKENNLQQSKIVLGCSNIVSVLDCYLKRKDKGEE